MRALGLLVCGLLLAPLAARADDLRGWGYLVERLAADGVDRERALRTFRDPRIAPFTGLGFGLDPREPRSMYRRFLGTASIAAARRCRAEHAAVLEAAERAHGVPASVVAAVLWVETGCGRNTGRSGILEALARLAMANEPANLDANIVRHAGRRGPDAALVARLRARARYLEDTFYPEVRATFALADRLGVDPLALRGSGSGAFGFPQFLPTSFLRYGSDGGDDGVVDLYDPADAAASCANYLAAHGWRGAMSEADRRAVIWHYNRSAAYVETVLTLARRIEGPSTAPPTRLVRHKVRKPAGGIVSAGKSARQSGA
ncbi:MAG TPA: lytic murein transglycosylase [Candidatus Binatia bacterium]|nr:lytic murein transglycosylase [Candidatus Binatia bacterium]